MNLTVCRAAIPSPLGILYCTADDTAVTAVLYEPDEIWETAVCADCPVLPRLRDELDGYFSGKLKNFTLSVKLTGTPHRLKVWNALRAIPYGETVSYKDIAQSVGSVPIAAGQAVGANRVNILVPCHRVVGSDGSLTGYGGGLRRKQLLLDLEGASNEA